MTMDETSSEYDGFEGSSDKALEDPGAGLAGIVGYINPFAFAAPTSQHRMKGTSIRKPGKPGKKHRLLILE